MNLGEIINRSIKLIYISKKPKDSEFRKIAKIAGLGAIVIGVIGMIISVILSYV